MQYLNVGTTSVRRASGTFKGGSSTVRGFAMSLADGQTLRGSPSGGSGSGVMNPPTVIPLRLDLIEKLCYFLELRGLSLEGIFRISGNATGVSELYSKFHLLTEEIDMYGFDPYDVAAALKQYFREQLEPLIPFEKFDPFIDAVASTESDEERVDALLALVEALPATNRMILRRLLLLLHETEKLRDVNKMTAENLGVCFGPTLMRPKVEDIRTLSRSNYQTTVFAVMITHVQQFLNKLQEVRSNYRIFAAPPPLTESDWQLLLATANAVIYQQDEVILQPEMENYNLYRILAGSVRIEKRNNVLGVLGHHELFGEMSFLGRYEVSAKAVADAANTKVQVIDSSYIQKILSLHPELFAKFYWNLTYSMAKRQQVREKEELKFLKGPNPGEVSASDPSKKANFLLKANHIVKVILKDGSTKTYTITDGTNAHGLCRIISNKGKIPHPEKYHLYEFGNDFESPKIVGDDEVISRKLAAVVNDPSYTLYYNTHTPSVIKTAVAIKEYQGITLKSKIGTLHIMPNNITFFMKLLGLEKKAVYFYKDLLIGDIQHTLEIPITDISRGGQIMTLTFRRVDDCKEACSILKWASEKDRAKRKDHRLGNTSKLTGSTELSTTSPRSRRFTRAIVAKAYNPTKPGELRLTDNAIVTVMEKADANWWSGECNNMTGRFPAANVVELTEAKATELLITEGYRDLQDLPTRTDWKLILMGGFTKKFQRNEIILKKNDRFQSVFQIVSGRCRIEKDIESSTTATPSSSSSSYSPLTTVIRYLDNNELFGDLSFLTGEGATANVVAQEDDTEVYVIPADYLQHIFKRDKVLMGRFFKYLAVVLERRLRVKQPKLEESDPSLIASLAELESIAQSLEGIDIHLEF